MNKSRLFKMAHKITRETIKDGDNYQANFGAALRILYKEIRNAERRYSEVPGWMNRPEELAEDLETYERRILRPTMSFGMKVELMGRIALIG